MASKRDFEIDVAISYASEDGEKVDAVARALKSQHIKIFYDKYEKAALWGEDLYIHLSDVYQHRARYCVIFCSKHYASKLWTKYEFRAAQIRALQENQAYILPIRLDDTEIPGLLPTIACLSWPPEDAATIVDTVIKKLGRTAYIPSSHNDAPQDVDFTTSHLDVGTSTSDRRGRYREDKENDAVEVYLKKIEKTYQRGNTTELSYRSALESLLYNLVSGITVTHEPMRKEYGSPDYVISRATNYGSLNVGYLETKSIDVSLGEVEHDAQHIEPRTHDGKQLKRYLAALDNLVLTNYCEFRWYLNGDLRLTARLISPIINKGLAVKKKGSQRAANSDITQLMTGLHAHNTVSVARLLTSFLTHNTEPIRQPKELAERMARIAHIIRDTTIVAFNEDEVPRPLSDLYQAFQDVLIPDLTIPDFADMFAQTLAYGLFAARYNHSGSAPFRRQEAAREIPSTNPFLADLFEKVTGRALDDVPFVGFVDDLTQLLAQTDMNAVLADFGKSTRQEDPLIHFYETFLAEYDPDTKELRGVYYTPEPVVSYIVRSVDTLLCTHFDCNAGLADTSTVSSTYRDEYGKEHEKQLPRVLLLDPACGTGTFLYTIINYIRDSYRQTNNAGMWSSHVSEHLLSHLFGFELLMAPYAMAHLKLGMQLAALDLPEIERSQWAYDFKSKERLGVYLTNSLEEAVSRSELLFARSISDEANAASEVKRDLPIMIVLGNPPYSGHSANRSWEVKDGKKVPTFIGKLLQDYYKVDGHPLKERNSKWLQDDYVKFIRFAQWRVERTGHGIIAFITNHGYLDNPTFRGMRQSLMRSFDEIYVLNLHGNSKKKERSPDGTRDENVFDIQQGVAIGIFVRRPGVVGPSRQATVYHADLWGPREIYYGQELIAGKYHWLADNDVKTTQWTRLEPQKPFYLFIPQDIDLRMEYEQGKKITEIMPINVLGFQTHRDHFAIDIDRKKLHKRIDEMRDESISDSEYAAKYDLTDNRDWQLSKARHLLRKDDDWQSKIIICLYRPFDWRFCYFSNIAMDYPRRELQSHVAGEENICLLASRQQAVLGYQHVWVANVVANDCALSTTSREANQVFPLYFYSRSRNDTLFDLEESSDAQNGRHLNLAPEFVLMLRERLNMEFIPGGKGDLQRSFGPEDIFNYIYSVLHSPTYRERYAEFLKGDFPRLPLISNADLFKGLCHFGDRLVQIHLMKQCGEIGLRYPMPGDNIVKRVDYSVSVDDSRLSRVWINQEQYFEMIPVDVWEFHVGGFQVCQRWLKNRKGHVLSLEDIRMFQRIVSALAETITLMDQIDEIIDNYGGWPIV